MTDTALKYIQMGDEIAILDGDSNRLGRLSPPTNFYPRQPKQVNPPAYIFSPSVLVELNSSQLLAIAAMLNRINGDEKWPALEK